jgi:Arc/MetJ-type ribon-helix-helix transcriptional regulator
MKISVSLTVADVGFLDEYTHNHAGVESRSAAIQDAIALLRESQLEADYAEAWQEWDDSPESAGWESTVADGMPAATSEPAHATR